MYDSTPWCLVLPDGSRLRIPSCGLLIGRSSGCDLVLDDPDLSRRHLLIVFMAGHPWVIDQGSSNGTLIDGLPLQRKRLGAKHTLTIGSTELLWETSQDNAMPFPDPLGSQWQTWRQCMKSGKFAKLGPEALRALGAAESVRVSPHGGLALSWSDPLGSESLGPWRRLLLEAALQEAPAK
jgi:predicted component of type VI protein secretion system